MAKLKIVLFGVFTKLLIILFVFTFPIVCKSQILPVGAKDYYKKGVKKIIEKSNWNKTISEYRNDFLVKETYYTNMNKKYSITTYEYLITDSLWIINISNTLKNNVEIVKIYFSNSICDSIRNGNSLRKVIFFKERSFLAKTKIPSFHYLYNYSNDTLLINEYFNNELIETNNIVFHNNSIQLYEVIINDNDACISDVIPWSKNETNRYCIEYAKFDIMNNWKKSYFITNKKKILKSKRTIKYI